MSEAVNEKKLNLSVFGLGRHPRGSTVLRH